MTILDLNAPGYTMRHWLTILLENREFDTSAPLAAEAKECDAFDQPAYKFLHGFKRVVKINLLWQLHWQERKDFDFFVFHCMPPNKNRTIHADCPAKVKGEHPKTLSQLYI